MFDGATNFRDIGGYRLPDGRTIRHGRVYRSNHFSQLTDDDVMGLGKLGIRTIFDLRGLDEAKAHPHRLPNPAPVVVPVTVEPRFQATLARLSGGVPVSPTPELVRQVMIEGYRAYATEHAPVFGRLLTRLADEDEPPVVIHCTAGKDRTGFAIAMILSALGLDRETIMADYLMTNERWRGPASLAPNLDESTRAPLFAADPVYLQTAFSTIEAAHGTIDTYLEQALGLDRSRRERLAAKLAE